MNLIKHRDKLITARDEMSRTIAAIDTVLAYMSAGKFTIAKSAIKKGDEKTGVKKSTLTKPFRPKKLTKKPKAVKRIRHMSPEGEARRRAGYYAYQERMRKEREAKTEAQGRYKGMRGTPHKLVGKAQSAAA